MPDAVIRSTEARIGEVLRQLREKLGLSLRTLAAQAGFSASFMSQVENGQVSPSIASLEKIAGELGVSLADLFEASQTPTPAVVRGDARPGFTSMWSKARVELLTPSGERRAVAAVAVSLTPGGASGKHPSNHPTDQFAYVTRRHHHVVHGGGGDLTGCWRCGDDPAKDAAPLAERRCGRSASPLGFLASVPLKGAVGLQRNMKDLVRHFHLLHVAS